jgi:flagellar basal-body rod protein FlgG
MFRALEIAASGMAGQQFSMDTVANNLANASTTGFKSGTAEFQELVGQVDGGTYIGQGARIAGSNRDLSQGAVQTTGQPLDLAINGSGYFPLVDPSGKEVYSRAGSFHLDADGRVVHESGDLLAGNLTIPQGAQGLTIGTDGTVSATVPGNSQPVVLGKIGLVGFSNEEGLLAQGQSVFSATDNSGPALRQENSALPLGLGSIQQGALEGSNVNMIDQMVSMINTQRAYETGAKVIQAADEMLGYANNMRR